MLNDGPQNQQTQKLLPGEEGKVGRNDQSQKRSPRHAAATEVKANEKKRSPESKHKLNKNMNGDETTAHSETEKATKPVMAQMKTLKSDGHKVQRKNRSKKTQLKGQQKTVLLKTTLHPAPQTVPEVTSLSKSEKKDPPATEQEAQVPAIVLATLVVRRTDPGVCCKSG